MKISKIEISNFRSFKEISLTPKNVCSLIGKNNSGKSNLLEALQVFFEDSKRLIEEESFHQKNTFEPIKIKLAFDNLNKWESEEFSSWIKEDKLTVERVFNYGSDSKITINTYAHLEKPSQEWLDPDEIGPDLRDEYWNDRKDELTINGISFKEKLEESMDGNKPNVDTWEDKAEEFFSENRNHFDEEDIEEYRKENPRGYKGVLKGALPELIYIPAVRDLEEETKVKKSNPFGQLINSIIDEFSSEEETILSEKLNEISDFLIV